jgi:hypothetical protein
MEYQDVFDVGSYDTMVGILLEISYDITNNKIGVPYSPKNDDVCFHPHSHDQLS